MPKKLALSQGLFATVDDDFVPPGKYHSIRGGRRLVYAARSLRREGGRRPIRLLHQDVLDLPQDTLREVDHIDGDGLNNCRENLRVVTHAENGRARARKRIGCSSQFRGVSWNNQRQKWTAYVTVNRKRYYLGLFDNDIQAAKTRDQKALELFGPIAHLNF